MKVNKWTLALAATGVVSLGSVMQAEESHPVGSLVSNTVLSGYVDTSAIWNFGTGSAQAARFANTAADRQDGFNLNTVALNLEKPLDEGTWAAGYKIQTMFGPDAAVMPGRLGQDSQLAFQQAYVSLRVPVGNGIDFKVGQFNPIIGYEVTDSYANPNFSRSMAFNTLEPFGHQGVLGTYQVSDIIGFSFGIANSQYGTTAGLQNTVGGAGDLNVKYNIESYKSYMAGIVIQAPEDLGFLAGSSLYSGVVGTLGGGAANSNPINIYVGGTMSTPWEALSLGAAFDYQIGGVDADFNAANGFQDSYAWAVAGYASLQITEQFKVNGRVEYNTSGSGIFAAAGTGAVTGRYVDANGDDTDRFFGLTLTADYKLWANVVSRVEFRWDTNLDGVRYFNNEKNDFSLAANLIYVF